MNDEWSLADNYNVEITTDKFMEFRHIYYTKQIIEELRQKLIEDLSEQFPKNQIEIEYIVNKRFGVDGNSSK